MRGFRSAFTLMEVNLAILIMATGVLGMVSLYSLGFRESLQSRDDVAGTGYADAFLAPLVAGLSATNMTWSSWRSIGGSSSESNVSDAVVPKNGWLDYVEKSNKGGTRTKVFQVKQNWQSAADGAFGELMSKVRSPYKGSLPSDKPPYYALVATRRGATISLAFRASRRIDQLMSQPIFYTEVHFQGDPNQ